MPNRLFLRSGHWPAAVLFLMLLAVSPALGKKQFEWIEPSKSDRALVELDWYPQAPAVFLNRSTLLVFGYEGVKGFPTRLHEYRRLKILNREGLRQATISLPSSRWAKIKDLDARIIQPGGEVRELTQADIFKKEKSERLRYRIVSFALPQAEVGSIIEYRYSVVLSNVIQPWQLFFQGWLPVLESTVAVEENEYVDYDIKVSNPLPQEPEVDVVDKHSQFKALATQRATYTMRNLPLVADEAFSPPFEELAARLELMPQKLEAGGWSKSLTGNGSWGYVVGRRALAYDEFGGWSPQTDALVNNAVKQFPDLRKRANAIYNFVHKEIRMGESPCKKLSMKDCSPDKMLKAKEADPLERLLLLRYMLHAADIKASIIWMSPRTLPKMDKNFPDTSKITYMLIRIYVNKEVIYLDPNGRNSEFGELEPQAEGIPGLVVDARAPRWITTPRLPATGSVRRASVHLTIDESGKIQGKGTLRLTGHQSWISELWEESHFALSRWQEWLDPGRFHLESPLQPHFPDLQIHEDDEPEAEPDGEIARSWSMESVDALDYFALTPSAPLSMMRNPFMLDVAHRETAVELPFPFMEVVQMRIEWPSGWELDIGPEPDLVVNQIGELRSELEVGESGLTYRRQVRVRQVDIESGREYAQLRELYDAWVHMDLDQIVLVKNQ